jgi:hypothetical protein
MADQTKVAGAPVVKRDRSPGYPFISLKTAIKRLAEFEKYFTRYPAPMDKVGLAWNMKPSSSQAAQTMSALKYFGLLRYDDSGESRVVSLTDDGRNYLRAQQDEIKQEIVKRCALKPKAIAKYWGMWGADRPKDPIALDELVLRGGFIETAASTFLEVYDETMAYAKLGATDKPDDGDGNGSGDDGGNPPLHEHELPPPPPPAKGGIKMRQDTFTLDEGAVSLQWPERLSKASYADLKDWLEIMSRKIERAVTTDDENKDSAD